MKPTNIIYGLVDPRTRLIRYIGLSSNGVRRPRDHRSPSCPDTYCRRWVRSLQRLGLDYEIVVLEVLKDAAELDQAERWWIAYGRACDWPLTNLTDGGGPSEAALAERRQRSAEYDRAKTERNRYSLEQCAALAEERKRKEAWFIARMNAYIAARPEGREAQRRALERVDARDPVEVEKLCFQLFDKHIGSKQLIVDIVLGARVTFEDADRLYQQWLEA